MLNHRGKILRAVIDRYCIANGMSITAVAKKTGYDQSTFYRHADKEELPFHIIRKYGRAIKHDFSQEFPEMAEELGMVEDPVFEGYHNRHTVTLTEAIEDRDRWREKYYQLLEIHNRMLTEKLENTTTDGNISHKKYK